MAGALIITVELGKADFAWLDSSRRTHYPATRNRVPAHLILFRTLPPSAEDEVRRSLARAAQMNRPPAEIAGVLDLDSGAAFRVSSPQLMRLREELADEFRGLLTSQDTGRWTPHVTIQNKAEPGFVRKLVQDLRASFEPRPLEITGLELIRYREGEWELVSRFGFRGR